MGGKQYVLMDYDLPQALLERRQRLHRDWNHLPSLRSVILPGLRSGRWFPRDDANQVMDELYALGARAILVSAIHAARI